MTAELANVNHEASLAPTEPAKLPLGRQGVMIVDMDGLARFARMYYASGLAPKGMNEAAIGVAVQMGLEVGLTPAQAVQSIAVINGRPGLFGPAALALVEASGLLVEIDEHYESGGRRVEGLTAFADTDAAVCVTRRKGRKAVATRFSVADAKRANLWGKAGPWSQYPQRMLKWRARGFNLGDNFGDVLRGLKTVEELQDCPDVPTESLPALPPPRAAEPVVEAPAPPVEEKPAKVQPPAATVADVLGRIRRKDEALAAAGKATAGQVMTECLSAWSGAGLPDPEKGWNAAQMKVAIGLATDTIKALESRPAPADEAGDAAE